MNTVIKNTEDKMQKSLAHFDKELSEIRAGRANAAVLDKVRVDYYGSPMPVNQLASISAVEARTLVIQPYDVSALKGIEKAIQKSDIGINPQNDGKTDWAVQSGGRRDHGGGGRPRRGAARAREIRAPRVRRFRENPQADHRQM